MVITVTRECIFNGDDEQKTKTFDYQPEEMLSFFLRTKVAEYLPYTSGLTVWAIYMGSNEDQPTSERESAEKNVAFIHKIENRCSKVEIRGGDRLVSSFNTDEMYCAVYKEDISMKRFWGLFATGVFLCVSITACGSKIDNSFPDDLNEYDMETVADSGGSEGSGTSEDSDTSEDSGGAMVSDEESANAEDSVTEVETSPLVIWEYEGYVDECEGYTWQEDFFDCDYDGDGKIDRVNRIWDGEKQTAIYEIEFGNGDKLITPEGPETGFPRIQSGDLDGDGIKEILIILTYDTSTDPYSYGNMWLFDRDQNSGEYVEAELPLVNDEYGGKGFNVDYDKPQDNKIRFTLREAGLSRTEEVDEEYLSNWWSDDLTTQLRVVYYAEITGDSNPVLRCYLEPLHRWGPMLGFNLNYVAGKYEIGYIEIDAPDSWG